MKVWDVRYHSSQPWVRHFSRAPRPVSATHLPRARSRTLPRSWSDFTRPRAPKSRCGPTSTMNWKVSVQRVAPRCMPLPSLSLSASPVLCLTYAMYMYAPAAAIRCDADPLHPTHGDPTLHRRGCPHTPEARWFARDEVLAVLNHTEGTNLSRQDHKELAAAAEGSNPHAKPDEANAQSKVAARTAPGPTGRAGPLFKIPPRTAIGGVILCEWAYGRAGPQPVSPKTANL